MSNPLKDTVAKLVNVAHRTAFDVTKGKIGGRLGSMPAVKLTTTGRKSGQPRTVMLTSPLQPDGDIVLVASYGGDAKHPAWYLNLQANPDVTIEMEGQVVQAVARTATEVEKSALWPKITSAYKGYAGYQERTDRSIPVVLCTPSSRPAGPVLPYSDGWLALTVAHLVATAAMVGLMWTIHFVHYPSFALVDTARYGEFQTQHMRRISWVLVLPWGTEALTALGIVVAAPDDDLRALGVVGLVLLGVAVAITALGAAPAHGRLLDGFDATLHQRLLAFDASRTVVWTLRLGIAVAVVWATIT